MVNLNSMYLYLDIRGLRGQVVRASRSKSQAFLPPVSESSSFVPGPPECEKVSVYLLKVGCFFHRYVYVIASGFSLPPT
jgi:hypothetical protein